MRLPQRVTRAILCGLLVCAAPMIAAEPSPVGLWRTIDDHTHRPRGVVRIYQENGSFVAKIETSFDPEERVARCEKCSDDRKNAPIMGLVIMRGITKHGSEYTGGEILDPDTGSIYRCRFTLSSDGGKLFLRGFLGISLLGRTQTWVRTDSAAEELPPVTKGVSTASLAGGSQR
jgi:uncharacterized protein (DUF2147 family)